jgi:two-component system chemotaxis sensor kinase CheA
MARLVRELSRTTGKPLRLLTQGDEIEIDRTLVEALHDPLVHLLRNAVDHGIEPLEERRRAGKAPVAALHLRASHAAGTLALEVRDDGRGLDHDRIVARAIERGLLEPGARLPERELLDLICLPGFSTAGHVTGLSGRGIGLDIVKTGVAQLRGRLEVASVPGQGTTFALRVPLPLAIADALLLRVASERYLLPCTGVERVFRPDPDALTHDPDGSERIALGPARLPLVRLHRLFDLPGGVRTHPSEGVLAIVHADGERLALLADELLGRQQVLIKPIGPGLGHVPGIAGGTVLPDGRVALVLDPAGLRQLAADVELVGEDTPPVPCAAPTVPAANELLPVA